MAYSVLCKVKITDHIKALPFKYRNRLFPRLNSILSLACVLLSCVTLSIIDYSYFSVQYWTRYVCLLTNKHTQGSATSC